MTHTAGECRPRLIIPYTLDSNHVKFSAANGFSTSEQLFQYLKNSFDVLSAEAEHRPQVLSMGMHGRLLGHSGRFKA
ncbi:hypothetical protein E0H94_15770 [Acinetobacter sp. ANC 4173]|nr:hypothetical protein E0H94_15770 [Acinetobacter sp. ANC 4173]